MIKAGIFDVGGVLHNNLDEAIFRDVSTTLGIDRSRLKQAWDKPRTLLATGKITETEFWALFLKEADVQVPLPKESLLLRSFIKNYSIHHRVIAVVEKLREQGYTMAVLSNTILPHARYQYAIGIYQHFDVVVLSHEVGLEKPDPEIFHYTLEKLHVTPGEAFFVDDLPVNVLAAQKLGLHALLYQTAAGLVSDLKKLLGDFES